MPPASAPPKARPRHTARALAILVAAAGCLSCGDSGDKLSTRVAQCARLSGAKQSATPGLAAAVRQIEARGEGPQQLVRPVAGDDNAAVALSRVMNDAIRLKLSEQLEPLTWPVGGAYSAEQIVLAQELLAKWSDLFSAIEQAGRLPRCEFAVRHDLGYFGRLEFLDDVRVAARLHMLAALAALARDDRGAACDHMETAADWVGWLSSVGRIEARLLAAQVRGEWLRVLSGVATRPASTADLDRLYTVLVAWLRAWPADRRSLVGDRALALHCYEAIRQGMLGNVLTIEEEQRLGGSGVLAAMKAMDARAIDRDELAYLEAMDVIISTSDTPFYRRAEELRALFDRFDPHSEAARAAPLATHLFLKNLPRALERMARDRGRCEAWALALASAADFDLPRFTANPLTGVEYQVQREENALGVRAGDAEVIDPYVLRPIDALGGERSGL